MTAPQLATYTFLPWVQRGVSRAIVATDDPATALTASVTLPVSVHVDGLTADVPSSVRLYGPGDVTGLDPAQIVRSDPPPGTSRFEAGFLPQVQFARAELPWLFTPAAPGSAKTRLRPWLVLVTIRRQDGVRITSNPSGPLPVLEIGTPASPAAELPDLAQSWAWAHAQITGLGAGAQPTDMLKSDPGRACSRLLCPRRLVPDTAYLACLVPAFAAGVRAGLGEPDDTSLAPAWGPAPPAPLRLPVYHSWEFATGPAGSFETLVRRLHPSPLGVAASLTPKLDLSAPGGGLPAAAGAVVGMQSALRVPGDDAPPPWPDASRVPFQTALERLLTTAPVDVLVAPVYGRLQAGAAGLPLAGGQPDWLREINLDPRLRVAAAVGARVVQERQEQFMSRAWEQAGAIHDANALLHRAQLARELGSVVVERHLAPLAPAELLAMTQPAHAKIALGGTTVDGELRASRVPEAVVSGAMRRLASSQGVLARRVSAAPQTQPIAMLDAVDRVAMRPATAAPGGMVMATFTAQPTAVDARPAVSADALRVQLLERLAPETTVLERAQGRVGAPATIWTRPDPLAPLAYDPHFPDPMYEGLQRLAPWLFLPGVETVEADGAALLETSPRVIEAYMAGLNHELSRELLWREFPSSLAGTAFRQFWDAPVEDIPALADWGGTPLGEHLRGGAGQLVLLVRGEVLRRYPTTTIYAARATATGTLDPATRLAPMFRGALAPDIAFLGFALSENSALTAPGWYFVFEQYPGEPRFGFDDVGTPGVVPTTPDALAWEHVPLSPSGHVDVNGPLAAGGNLPSVWGKTSAGMASLTFQQPFRVALHASRLIVRSAQ